jgi:hypothetical protein
LRDYESGDWFAVPLGDGRFADTLVVRYAPRVAAAHVFSPAGDLLWAARVYDRPIRERRWARVRAPRQIGFAALPMPNGYALDPRIFEAAVAKLLGGEALIRSRVCAYDLQPPFDAARILSMPPDAIVQWRRQISSDDLQIVARAIEVHPETTIRLYGQAGAQIDEVSRAVRALRWHLDAVAFSKQRTAIESARELTLDARPGGLLGFPNLERLSIRLHGEDLDAVALLGAPKLRSVTISGGSVKNANAFGAKELLEKLDLVDVTLDDVDAVMQLEHLRALRLKRVKRVTSLAALANHPQLQYLALEDLTHVDDLRPLVQIPQLESLELTGAWQFGVGDLALVTEMPGLQRLRVDIGGLRKNAEIYALRPFATPPLFDSLTF